jgi:hypothetical protein|tara:strand:- start:828 stop:1106 length:279 start_codon:yes stop_codon:yes gene_type:complete
MPLEDQNDILIRSYTRRPSPQTIENLVLFMSEELKNLELSIQSIADAAPQATDRAPEKPRRGMVRYAVSPWNPLSNSYSGLVVYNGTAWVAV